MLAWKSSRHGITLSRTARARWHAALLCWVLVGTLPITAWSADITVQNATVSVLNRIFMLNADLDFAFSDDTIEALESGVPLFIELQLTIKRRRKYLKDPSVMRSSHSYRIERNALSEQYIIVNLTTGDNMSYPSLSAAIAALGQIRDVPVTEVKLLDRAQSYRLGLRARLDIESLPAPMRPIAYVSPSWWMSSGWHWLELDLHPAQAALP